MRTNLPRPRAFRAAIRRPPFRRSMRPVLEALESRIVPSMLDHSAGFANHGDLVNNGSASFTGSVARLTDGGSFEAGSILTNARFNIAQFTTQFTFVQAMGTDPTGGGLTFIIEADPRGPAALGPASSGLGYGPDTPGEPPGITNSVAIKFDLYDNFGEGNSSTASSPGAGRRRCVNLG
jgi:Bacterial lectin